MEWGQDRAWLQIFLTKKTKKKCRRMMNKIYDMKNKNNKY